MTIPITDILTATAENGAIELAMRGESVTAPVPWLIAIRVGAGDLQIALGLTTSSTVLIWNSASGTAQELVGTDVGSSILNLASDATIVIASKALITNAIRLELFGSSVGSASFESTMLARLTAVTALTIMAAPPSLTALTALPQSRYPEVYKNAELAAIDATTETGSTVTAQDVVDALAVGRGMAILLPGWGCLLSSSGGAEVAQGAAVGAFRSLRGVEYGVQANATLRPVSAADGLFSDGTKWMNSAGILSSNIANLSLFSLALYPSGGVSFGYRSGTQELIQVNHATGVQVRDSGNSLVPLLASQSFDNSIIYFRKNGTLIEASKNGGTPSTATLPTGVIRSSRSWFFCTSQDGTNPLVPASSTMQAIHLSEALMTTAQRSAIKHFLKRLFNISGVV